MRKIWLVIMIVSSLFIVSMNSVLADDELTLQDVAGDVYDSDNEKNVTSKPSIDIRQAVVSIQSTTITITITMEDVIEDDGNILYFKYSYDPEFIEQLYNMSEEELMELEEILGSSLVGYAIFLSSSDDSYSIFYVNGEALVYDEDFNSLPNDFSVQGNDLSISFELNNADEEIAVIDVITFDFPDAEHFGYSDEAYGEFDAGDGDTENGDGTGDDGNQDAGDDNGSSGGIGGSAILIFVAVIAVICIVGVAIVIFIIRR